MSGIGSTESQSEPVEQGITLGRLIAAERNALSALQRAMHDDEVLATVLARMEGLEKRVLTLESKFSSVDEKVQALTVKLMGSGPTA